MVANSGMQLSGLASPPPQAKPAEPPPHKKEETQRPDLTGYWIGGLPVYQAGGPPLDFEKTGLSLFGLRVSVGLIGHVCADKNW